jgi:hypothetical protein
MKYDTQRQLRYLRIAMQNIKAKPSERDLILSVLETIARRLEEAADREAKNGR